MKNGVLAVCLSLAVHAALAVALLAYLRYAPRPDTPATLDLSSVELSFAEKDDETAAVRPVAPAEPQPPVSPKPQPLEPPRETEKLPLPPDPSALKLPDPVETHPEMVTPPQPVETPPEQQSEPPKSVRAAAPVPALAVAPRQAKVDAPPRPRRTIRPVYPKGARQRGEQGEVTLEIEVTAGGTVTDARVVGSCGFAELDAAAVTAARGARFVPARSGDRPVASVVRLKVSFRLK